MRVCSDCGTPFIQGMTKCPHCSSWLHRLAKLIPQYSLRKLFYWTFIVGLLLMVLRRPLSAVIDFMSVAFWPEHLLVPFLHIPWLLGFDVTYEVQKIPESDPLGLRIGVHLWVYLATVVSCFCHYFLACGLLLLITIAKDLSDGQNVDWEMIQEKAKPYFKKENFGFALLVSAVFSIPFSIILLIKVIEP